MKDFLLSELREFAVIMKVDNKDEMLHKFKVWYKNTVYEFCRREQICIILRSYYGSVDAQWDEIATHAEQNYRQDTEDALTDVYERYRREWFEQLYSRYRRHRLFLKSLEQNKKWYSFLRRWKAKYQLKKADSRLSLRDILQVAGCVYVQKGGHLSCFKTVMNT